MAASQAEARPFGGVIRCDDRLPGPASHDGTGRRFVFCPADDRRYALDVERRDLPVPEHLARVLGARALRRWGTVEVIAKLLDTPAHLVLRRVLAGEGPHLLRAHGIRLLRADTPDLWRIVGCRRSL